MIRAQRVESAGRTIHYLENGAGWPVVLLHGFPLHAEMWRPQLDDVPDGWRFIAPDLRGFGQSAGLAPGEHPTMDDYAADVAQLLDVLEIERAVIGGLSMGGYVAFALFRRSPERYERMVLADTRAEADTPEGRQNRRAMSDLVKARGASAVADRMLPGLLGETTRREKPDLVAAVRHMIEGAGEAAIDGAINALLTRPDSTPDLERITCPTLVIVGEEDGITPVAHSEALTAAVRRSHLVVVPRAGHLSNLEQPQAFSRALEDFLASNF